MTARSIKSGIASAALRGLLLMLAAGAIPGCTDAAPTAPQTSRIVERSFFGMHVHWNNQDVRLTLPPVGSLRLWDTQTNWNNLEPRRGEWDFRRLDRFIDLAKKLDADVLMTFGATPKWAAARRNATGAYGPGTSSPPADMRDWEAYVRTVAERYRGRIRYYELINEPALMLPTDNCMRRLTFYCVTPRELADLGNRTRAVIKAVDPRASVNSPGFVHPHLIREYIQAGGPAAAYDAHQYPKPESAKQAERWAEFREVLTATGRPGARLWHTEGGLPVADEGYDPSERYIPATEQPGAIARFLILAAATGIERVFYYSWDHRKFGLSTDMGTTPSAAGIGYLRTMTWLLGARISPCRAEDNVWRCPVSRGAVKGTIVWYDASGERSIDVSGGGRSASFVHRMDGSTKPSSNGMLKVGREPVLVTFGSPKWGVEQKFVKL